MIKRLSKYLLIITLTTFVFFITYYSSNTYEHTSEAKIKYSNNKKDNKTTKTNKTVYVDIKGAVNNPGVYELDYDKRVIDVVKEAGGLNKYADTININLSKKIEDEMIIIVYTKSEIENYYKKNNNKNAVCASLECTCPDNFNNACITKDNFSLSSNKNNIKEEQKNTKISINTATKEELMSLDGIGEAKAQSIINYRQENGSFEKIEDIKNISGIGDSIFEKIKNSITL